MVEKNKTDNVKQSKSKPKQNTIATAKSGEVPVLGMISVGTSYSTRPLFLGDGKGPMEESLED